MAKSLVYVDLITHRRKSIDYTELEKQLDNLKVLMEKQAAKLKKINGYTLTSFDITFGITAGVPVLSASGGLTLTYTVP